MNLKKHLQKGDKIIIGCSGGADSTYLVHRATEICAEIDVKIVIAHLNHKTRNESDSDEQFVKDLGKKLGLKVITDSKTFEKFSEEEGRNARRKFFEDLRKKEKAKYILLAHHLDDNTETILMNFARGSGLTGLKGMSELSGKILRPLLQIEKSEILKYLEENNLEFREDATNQDNSYTRNHYRNLVIPTMKKKNTNLSGRISKSAKNFSEIEDFIAQEARQWIEQQSSHSHDLKDFRLLHPALQKEILRQLYRQIKGDLKELESKHIEEVLDMLINSHSGKGKNLGKHTVVEIKGKSFKIKAI